MTAADRDDRVATDIVAPLREANVALDELHQARLASKIEAALDQTDRGPVRPARRRGAARGWVGAALAGSAALALVATVLLRPPQPPSPPAAAGPTTVALSKPPAPAVLVQRVASRGAVATPSTSLLALAGERARATVGPRVRLTLIGPGRVSVLSAGPDGNIDLALDGGRLLVDYDGRAGGTLHVRSPGAITTVVGTLFAVDVTPFGSRVAVAHGRVRTQDASGRVWQIAAGTNWSSVDERVLPLGQDLATAMREHQASWSASVSPAPAAPPAAAPPVRRTAMAPQRVTPAPEANVDLDALYSQAEDAMRRRAMAEARGALEIIAGRDPTGRLGHAALLDLARLALGEGDRAQAQRLLRRLPDPLPDPTLQQIAAHLRCRAEHPADAASSCPAADLH